MVNKVSRFLGLMCVLVIAFQSSAGAVEKKNDQLAVFTVPGKAPEAIRASDLEIRDLVVISLDSAGRKRAYQRDFFQGSVPLFPLDAEKVSAEMAESVLSEYQTLIQKVPAAEKFLSGEQSKWRDELTRIKYQQKQEAARRAEKMKAEVDAFLKMPYEPQKNYKQDVLLRVIAKGNALTGKVPSRAAEIESVLAPWKKHLENLSAGLQLVDGKWVNLRGLQERRKAMIQEAIDQFLESGVKYSMESVVVPQTSMLLGIGSIVTTLVLVLYMFLWLASSHGGTLTFGGALLMLFGLAVLAGYGYFGFKLFSGPTTIDEYFALNGIVSPEKVDHTVLKRALFLASKPEELSLSKKDFKIVLTDQQVNDLLKNNVEYVRQGEPELFDLERVRFACVFTSDRVVLLNDVVVFGKPFLIRYEFNHRVSGKDIVFDGLRAYWGNSLMIGQLEAYFWMKMHKDLKSFLEETGLIEIYQISDMKQGEMTLLMSKIPAKNEGKPEAEPVTGAK